MISQMQLLKVVGIAFLSLSMAVTLAATAMETSKASSAPGVYQGLLHAAEKGDYGAAAFQVQFNAFLASKGESTIEQERSVREAHQVNGVGILVKGQEPYYLKVMNSPSLSSEEQFDAYVGKRKSSLAALAKHDPDCTLEVSISPLDHLPLGTAWRLRDFYRLDVDQMLVTLFLDGRRHSVMFVSEPRQPGHVPYIDLEAEVGALEARLRQLLPQHLVLQGISTRPELELKIEWLRGKARAEDALALSHDPAILVVDPITDLLKPFQGRAAQVDVVQMPYLLSKRMHLGALRSQP